MNPPTPSLIAAPNSARPQVACYYFPNYHVDVRNQPVHGQGWSEWELVKAATPRWPGHSQPNLPLWGYTDEADPVQMGQMVNDNQFPAVTTGINRHNVSGKGEGSKGRGRSPRPSGKKIFGEGLRGGVLRTPPPPDRLG